MCMHKCTCGFGCARVGVGAYAWVCESMQVSALNVWMRVLCARAYACVRARVCVYLSACVGALCRSGMRAISGIALS